MNPGFATPLLHYADDLHRHRLQRQAIFLLLLTLHKLFIMQHFFLLLLLSPVCTIFCAQENYPARLYPLAPPRLDGGLRQHFITPCRGLPDHHFGVPSSLLRHLGTGSGMEPSPASSSDRVINAEHINQLSRSHTQKLSVLNFVRCDQALYLFGIKLFVTKFLVKTLFASHIFKYPVYLGAPLMELFLLHMIILVRLRSLFVYYATICTMLT